MQVEVQIITLNPKVPQQEIDNVKARLRDFSEQVNKGERDFSTLAVLYSEDRGSAMMGGEMGFVSKSNLVPEFANVAFNLNDPKKVSKIWLPYYTVDREERRPYKCSAYITSSARFRERYIRCFGSSRFVEGRFDR